MSQGPQAVPADELVHVLDSGSTARDELEAICRSGLQEEAFYTCDLDDIVHKMNQWRQILPRVEPHYAVKCNYSPAVLRTLAALGAGFDCASKGEVAQVLGMGVDPSRIVFAHPAKCISHIRYAAAHDVDLSTFDNETELQKMKQLYPKSRLLMRIRCDAENSVSRLGLKYGCDAPTEGRRLLATARDLGLQVVGVSFHVGSGARDAPAFRRAIQMSKTMFDAGRELGHNMSLLDIGGGFLGHDKEEFLRVADVINTALTDFFPDPDVRVISEPGRYFVDTAFTLATLVHSKRELLDKDGRLSSVMYFLNDGVYGSFFDLLLGEKFFGYPLDPPAGEPVPSSVWGPTCDCVDVIEEGKMLPPLPLGSWMVYNNKGAYTRCIASNFNGFPIPKVHAVCSPAVWKLLRDRPPMSERSFAPSLCAASSMPELADLVDAARRLSLGRRGSQDLAQDLPCLLAGCRRGSQDLPVMPLSCRRGSQDLPVMPLSCRRGSLIDQADLSTRPVF